MTTRTPLLLLMAMISALALAACGGSGGGGGSGGSGTSGEDKAFEGALKFASCMRDHGVDMPDPTRGTNGGIKIQAGRAAGKGGGPEKGLSPGPGNPKFKEAEKACGKYLTKGGGAARSPAEQAKQRDAFLAYARCMRGKGINMPDPKFEGNGIGLMLPRGTNPESARFKAAEAACHPILAEVEPKGAKGGPVNQAGGAD